MAKYVKCPLAEALIVTPAVAERVDVVVGVAVVLIRTNTVPLISPPTGTVGIRFDDRTNLLGNLLNLLGSLRNSEAESAVRDGSFIR